MPLHPVHTTDRIRQSYIRYLKTIKPFQDDRYRQEFAHALEEENLLVKGPYIELTPPFKLGKSLQALIEEGVLTPGFKNFFHAHGFNADRPLYLHQEEAVRKVNERHNIVVTTGTGSGKTEAFLIPILDTLEREAQAGTLSQPGVRALLLYPLNALANDQMERLRGYLSNYPQITYGRYVGETKSATREAIEQYAQIHKDHPQPLPNELISREQMQAAPPHILLTNYAMLEYLLLRPADTNLFDGETGKHWRFIVLDEAHAYDGAQATEIAMLLRRLQDRVTGGKKKLQAIATSATLGEDTPESRQQIATFASRLFNMDFTPQDVIFGKRLPDSGLDATWGSGSLSLYAALEALADAWREGQNPPQPDSLPGINKTILDAARHASTNAEETVPRFLYELLKGDENVHHLRRELQASPLLMHEAARIVFDNLPEADSQTALASLISVAILARQSRDKAALLPARYHLFVRALEGAFVCLNHTHPAHQQEDKPLLFLTRQKFCPYCGSRVFELANCTRCGESYLIGEERPGIEISETEDSSDIQIQPYTAYLVQSSVIYESDQIARKVDYFVLEGLEVAKADEDAFIEGDAEIEEKADETMEAMQICPHCGALYQSGLSENRCACGVDLLTVSKVDVSKQRTLKRCVSCSTFGKSGVIYRFLTGQDAPVSVLAGTLYKDVPPARKEEERQKPGEGRKMLLFTDSRQRAAFFAPYLQRAQDRQLRRRIMVESLKNLSHDEPLRFSDWMDILLSQSKKLGVFSHETSYREKRLTVATWLMQEFSGLDKRLSLEGVGLLYFRPFRFSNWRAPDELFAPPWNLSPQESYNLLSILLNTLRRQGAVTYLLEAEDIHLLDSEKKDEFRPRARLFYVSQTNASNSKGFGVYAWQPSPNFKNSRLDYLNRLLRHIKGEQQPSEDTNQQSAQLLSTLWEYLTSLTQDAWFEKDVKNGVGTVYRLRHDMWEVIPTLQSTSGWYVCEKCGNLTAFQVQGVCPTYGCQGALYPLTPDHPTICDNLYRYNYTEESPIPLKAAEHTAQWKPEKAAEVQQRFITGDINVLSCSTTFEMGVDVGDLNAILLRNMPPSTANYVQRAGRAGRRTESPSLVVTFAQRRSHDLTFYAEPERMIAGKLRPPVVPLKNDKIIRRHLHSVTFAAFLRWAKDTYGYEYRFCGDFFAPEDPDKNGLVLLQQFLKSHPSELEQALIRILPSDLELRQHIAFDQWGWLPFLIGSEEAVLDKAAQDIMGELQEFENLERIASSERRYLDADQAQKIQNTIRKRDLLGYLGSKNVLPKYGFPTDVVALKTDHLHLPGADSIELERDLKIAISEFAPGGQVVAAGRIWYSRGLRKVPGRSWVPYGYAVCTHCKRMIIEPGRQTPLRCTCGAPVQNSKLKGVYIVPEYGFLAGSQTDIPGEQPPERIYASRVYLADYRAVHDQPFDPQNVESDPEFFKGVRVFKGYTRYAYLSSVNDGYHRGFKVCQVCGYSDVIELLSGNRKINKAHLNPLTQEKCSGVLETYDLGHHFMTDVLQLRLEMPIGDESATYSLLYAILNGASDTLEIPREDIGGLIFFQDGQPSFLLYDTTPGGSGHVEMIYNHLHQAIEGAYKRVATCDGCSRDTSCYSCLRGYDNQPFHDILIRGRAENLLSKVLGKETF
ncbi:MAG: DEAD/DEAH box helicase [Chloroflexota bacterium]